jgi:hypothetical protein
MFLESNLVISPDEHVRKLPAARRKTVEAARRAVRSVAPRAEEISYPAGPPKSATYMWKLLRYADGRGNVVGIGTFAKHSTLFFYRGRELEDGSGLLQGGGKDMRFIRLVDPADAEQPAVKRMVKKAFQLGGQASPH